MHGLGPSPYGARPTPRDVDDVVELVGVKEADVPTRRAFPTAHVDGRDPFLLLDRLGPEPTEGARIRAQPCQRVEVLTWIRSGAATQRASRGPLAESTAGPGDWLHLLAGDGVVHDLSFEGHVDAVTLWVDLPKRRERAEPELQHHRAEAVPTVVLGGDSRVRVIAGTFGDAVGPVSLHADVQILHVYLEPDAVLAHLVPGGTSVTALVVHGFATVGPGLKTAARPAKGGELVRWDSDGTEARMAAARAGTELLLFVGAPLRQKLVRYGPFVARDEAGIREGMFRFQRGRFGTLAAVPK